MTPERRVGTCVVVGEPMPAFPRPHLRGRTVYATTLLIAWAAFCIWLGVSQFGYSWHELPAAYKALRQRGVPATARLDKCAPGIGGGRDVGCQLTLVFRGRIKTWAYPENTPQFDRLRPGDPVPVLVDPQNPSVVYTAQDVSRRTNTGNFAYWGLIFVGVGLLPLASIGWTEYRVRKKMRRLIERRNRNSSG